MENGKRLIYNGTKENIESATKLGFKTILFTNSKDLRKKLIEYNVDTGRTDKDRIFHV